MGKFLERFYGSTVVNRTNFTPNSFFLVAHSPHFRRNISAYLVISPQKRVEYNILDNKCLVDFTFALSFKMSNYEM